MPVNGESEKKLVMVRTWKEETTAKKIEWQNGWLSAWFDEFGFFQIFNDNQLPQVNDPGKKVKGKDTIDLSKTDRIVFTPVDNYGIRSFRAELDGKWLMFSNDKTKNYIYKFDEHCPYGVHELKVRVEDIVGNVIEKTWWFKRSLYTPPPKKNVSSKKKVTSKKK